VSDDSDVPQEIPTPSLPEGWDGDFLSDAEAQYWGQYDEISEARKANKLVVHRVFRWIIPLAIGSAFLAFSVVLGVYVAHLVLPSRLRWLTPEELQQIHNMIFSSVVGGAVAIFGKTYFLDSSDDKKD
jgi:hypothetical protein